MKKLILTIMMFASFQGFAGQDGGGGGVLKRDGMYLTFGSAKVKIGAPLMQNQIPGLSLLMDVITADQPGVPDEYQGRLVNAFLPDIERRYFRIDQSQLDSNTHTRLILEYSKLLNNQIDPNNLYLAAVTIKGDTFLLPPFFQLKPAEQAAILFHESLWIIKPTITYDELVSAEMSMQAHIETYGTIPTYDENLIRTMLTIFSKSTEQVAFVRHAIYEDVESGFFEKYKFPKEKDGSYNLSKLFPRLSGGIMNGTEEYNLFLSELLKLTKIYPESKYFKALWLFRNLITMISTSELTMVRSNVLFYRIIPIYHDKDTGLFIGNKYVLKIKKEVEEK